MTEATEKKEVDYFGGCPVEGCRENDGFLNIGGDHWFVCHNHKTKWRTGSNLFSAWLEENEEIWVKNTERISEYTEVEPVYDPKQRMNTRIWVDESLPF
jgi:hypothetical protein